MKKFIGILSILIMLSVTSAAEISFDPASGSFGNDCIVPVDIVVDTTDKTISATDIIMESSMEFVDFVPTKVFPYYLSPKILSNIVHIVWFTVDESQRFNWKSVIWTAYFKQRLSSDSDWSIRLYFENKWNTTDSNLSIAWWVDVLDSVGSAYYTFDWNDSCIHEVSDIKWWINDASLDETLSKIEKDQSANKVMLFISSNIYALSLALIVIIFVVFYLWKKKKHAK